ncbi:MAG TPA: hypothetical protein VKI64_00465 [Acidimicrobiales bacterium]|nr:hypothetical protein [Acidimicrobiales bacterium]
MRLWRRDPVRPTGTYTQWQWPSAPDGYRGFQWELSPGTDPSPDGYFWSHQFWIEGGEAGYAGLQTEGSEPTGKIAIFSVWGAVRAQGPSYAAAFGGEGSGFSVRIPYEWRVGSTYRLSIAAAGAARWSARVTELGGDLDRPVGEIEVPSGWGGLRDVSVMWTERYSGPLSSCADIRRAETVFSVPVAEGGSVPAGRRNYLADPRGCPGSAVTDVPDGVLHVMGGRG